MRIAARVTTYAVGTTLALTGTLAVTTAPSQAATHDPVGVQTGSAWLAKQAAATGTYKITYSYNGQTDSYQDYGLTVDGIESLVEADQQGSTVARMTDAVASQGSSYAATTGGAAKLLTLADITGRDPRTFAGGGLVSTVENAISSAPADAGALQDAYAAVPAQVYAVRGLNAVSSAKTSSALTFLLRQQCAGGFFQESWQDHVTCDDAVSSPSVDTTAQAVIELADHVSGTADAVARARAWLAGKQLADGSWGDNANSTGLAARALGDGPRAERAATWLYRHQVPTPPPAKLSNDAGAVVLDDLGLENAKAYGFDDVERSVALRASAQSVSVLRWLPATSTGTLRLSAPSGYLESGTTVPFTVTGTKAGNVLTLTGPGTSRTGKATGSTWTTRVTLPAGTAARTYTISDNHGHLARRTVSVLGAKRLAVTPSRQRLHRSQRVTVVVRGLAPREHAVVRFRGRVVERATASSTGVVRATFRVGRVTGRQTVVAVGQFRDLRRGTTTLRVLR